MSPQAARCSCHSSPTHTPSPKEESLATKSGPSPLPCSIGHWEGPLALVSLAELTPDGYVFSMPAAKAGASSQHAGQGVPAPAQRVAATAKLPRPRLLVSPEMACRAAGARSRKPHRPRLRAAVLLLACPSLHLRGIVGSRIRRWWVTAPQDRAESQPSGPGCHMLSPFLSRGSLQGSWGLGPTRWGGGSHQHTWGAEDGQLPREHSLPSTLMRTQGPR